MSKYEELRTVLSEERFLVEALWELGYSPEVSSEGMSLYGYLGDERAEKTHIVIRRRQLDSPSNDIGFARDSNGVYRALISEYDRGIKFNNTWLGRVAQTYKERRTMAVAPRASPVGGPKMRATGSELIWPVAAIALIL